MCGILGVVCKNCPNQKRDVFPDLMVGGRNLRHRGPQGWGLFTSNGSDTFVHHKEGGFGEGITKRGTILLAKKMPGDAGLAHTLYSTRGKDGQKKQPQYTQPRIADFHGKTFGLSYNGNVYDLSCLRKRARNRGWIFKSEISDTEVIVALISTSDKTDFVEALKEILPLLKGAFSLVFLYDGKIIGARDRCGFRPFCIGLNDSAVILSSESCVFHSLGAKFFREVRPGEIVVIGDKGIERDIMWTEDTCSKFCIFEFVYFARPDSRLCHGQSARNYREQAGMLLAKEEKEEVVRNKTKLVEADLVVSVPAGGDIFAEAYAWEMGLRCKQGLFKGWGTKTFLARRDVDRRKLQRNLLHPMSEVLYNKRVIVVDDSIVRKNASPEIVAMCFEAGAAEVHMRIGSSRIEYECYYGIDMHKKEELAAAKYNTEEIRGQLGVKSLRYLSLNGMVEATGLPKESLCMACFDGNYPVPPPVEMD